MGAIQDLKRKTLRTTSCRRPGGGSLTLQRNLHCRGDCGIEKWVLAGNLKSGNSTSCGCFRSERHLPARARTASPRHVTEARHKSGWPGAQCGNGARIPPALASRTTVAEVSPSIRPGTTIRLSSSTWAANRLRYTRYGGRNNNLGYSKDNCVWATKTEQAKTTAAVTGS